MPTQHLVGCGLRIKVTGPERALRSVGCIGMRVSTAEGRTDRAYVVKTSTVGEVNDEILWFVAEHARTRVFVHAGAVGVDGGAVLIPGRSRTGKSSLVAALVRAGATYYSDEFAVMDKRGRVHPFARALSMRPYDGSAVVDVPASVFGGTTGTKPLPVRAIVVTSYRDGATWRATARARGAGALALIDNAVAARTHSARVLLALTTAASGAVVYESARGDADATAARILRKLNAVRSGPRA